MSVLQEFLHYAVGTILVFIASIVAAVKSHGISALVAGSVSTPTPPTPALCLALIYIQNRAAPCGEKVYIVKVLLHITFEIFNTFKIIVFFF